MTKAKEQLKKADKIIKERNIDEFLNLIKDKNGLVDGLDLNTLYNLLEKYREDYKKEVEKTEKKLNKADKEVKLNYEELIKITTEFKEYINKNDNLKMGHELRKKPKYNPEIAEKVQKEIEEKGLIGYLEPLLDKLHLGNHRNIYRKLLMAVSIMTGTGSYLSETVADSEAGKSLEDEIVFLKMIPPEYIFKKNDITEASLTRYGDINEYYFDRLIIYFGDLGSKKSYEKLEFIFNILKILITEKEYSRDLCDNNNNNITLILKANSIGGAYSTVKNSFTEDDTQLISRTIKSTPPTIEPNKIKKFRMLTKHTPMSPKAKEAKEAEAKLKNFQEYLKMKVNEYTEMKEENKTIINPFVDMFISFSESADKEIREFNQQIELFSMYCLLTDHNCKNTNDYKIASQTQVNEYFNSIALENTLIPYESNFLKMLMAKNKTHELIILDENDPNHLNKYINSAMESKQIVSDENTFDDLDEGDRRQIINTLMKKYRLNSSSNEHKEKVFFTVTDVSKVYKKHKDYKNIDDVPLLLAKLHKDGYIGKLEDKYRNNYNIYYLTKKTEQINKKIGELTEKQIIEANNFLNEIGFYNN